MVIGDLLSKNLFAALTVGLRHYVLVHCKADPDQDAPEHPGMKPRRPSGIINAETAAQLGLMITPAQKMALDPTVMDSKPKIVLAQAEIALDALCTVLCAGESGTPTQLQKVRVLCTSVLKLTGGSEPGNHVVDVGMAHSVQKEIDHHAYKKATSEIKPKTPPKVEKPPKAEKSPKAAVPTRTPPPEDLSAMEHADLAVIQSVLSRYHAMPVEERTQLVPVFAKLLAGVGQQPQPEPKYGDDEDDEESDATATTDVHGNPITDRSPLMPGHPDPRLVRRQQSPKVGNAKSSTPLDRARASRASRGQSRGSQELGVVTLASGETMMLRRSSSAGLVSAGHPRIGSQVALSPPIGPCARTE